MTPTIRATTTTAILACALLFSAGVGAAQSRMPTALVATGTTIRITKSGSYYLPRNLISHLKNQPVVLVTVSNVTLNLNGCSIIGPGGSGGSVGIDAAGVTNVTVVNGTITNIAGPALELGAYGEVSGMRILGNAGDGADCSSACLANGNIVAGNSGVGLNFGSDATSGYQNNVLNGNDASIVGGTNLGHNVINGVPTTP